MADDKEMSAPVMDGNGAATGHIISTTIGGKNGEPKQQSKLAPNRIPRRRTVERSRQTMSATDLTEFGRSADSQQDRVLEEMEDCGTNQQEDYHSIHSM